MSGRKDAGAGRSARADLAARLRRGDPALAESLRRLRRERWHLWQVIWRVYAGEGVDPSIAEACSRDAASGGLPGRLQQGFLEEALDRLAEIEDEGSENRT